MLTRKHFKRLAEILGDNDADETLIYDVVRFCREENSRFDRDRFNAAIKKARAERVTS